MNDHKPTQQQSLARANGQLRLEIEERRQAENELRRTHDELRREQETLRHLLQASDHERQLIAYEIHDGLTQQLAAAIMQFQSFEHLKVEDPAEAANAFHAGLAMLRQGHFEARRLISGVRPPILDEAGIVAAVAHLVHEQRHSKGPKIEFHSEVDFQRLAVTLENAIYRITQEALTNACRYSKSDKIRVALIQEAESIRIEVQDWGVGFDLQQIDRNRFGLEGIRERARLLGGQSTIDTSPGRGTRVVVSLPLVT